MTGFLLAFLATVLTGIGARDQTLIAALSARQGERPLLLATGIVTSYLTAGTAAWAAVAISPMLAPNASLLMAAIALGFAGAESLFLTPRRKPGEPTNSLGAAAIVLLADQLTDAARFLIFAIALATHAPISAGLGGAAGGAATITLGWLAGDALLRPETRFARRITGALLLALAVFLGLQALGKI